MDAVAGLLDAPRARGAFLLRAVMNPPWSVRVQDQAPLTLVAILRGEAWVVPDKPPREAARLEAGDVTVLRGPDAYTVADDPATPRHVVIHAGQHCTTPQGEDLSQTMKLGVRSWGNNPKGSLEMLVGTYRIQGEVATRLLDALPALLILREARDLPYLSELSNEVVKDEPGQEVVLDRLLDVLLISVLRTWFARPEAKPPGWYRAIGDPVVGRALRLMHGHPARRWTVAGLATTVGVSRAVLARRFTALVGEPPITYLTAYRMDLAADLLREPGVTIGAVARQVGYGNAFALSTAFKRVRGVSPQQHRDVAFH